jgi:4a-hydroxytetrahydrobiopterin dehydratase
MDLTQKKCVPCEGGMPKLSADQTATLARETPGWTVRDEKVHRRFEFPDFRAAIRFVNQMAELAEAEGHHPNFSVDYSKVDVTIWTHAIGGLSENDFILAAKIDRL